MGLSRLLGKSSAVWGTCDPQRGWGTEDEGCWWVLEQEAQGQLGGPSAPTPCAEASELGCRSLEDKVVLQEMWGSPCRALTGCPSPAEGFPIPKRLFEPRAALSPGLWT